MKKILLTFILLTGFSASLIADTPILVPTINYSHYTKVYNGCMDNAKTTRDYSMCIGEESEKQDVLLNKVYNNAMKVLSSSRKKQLGNAQRAWIKYKDANCNWYYNPNGGSSAIIESAQCNLNMTVSRRLEMEWDGFCG